MKQEKKKISIRLDVDKVEKLRILAEKDNRSLSQYINRILKMHVASKEEHDGAT